MSFLIDPEDEDCRYIPALGSRHHGFGDFLDRVGVALPPSIDLREVVRNGWLRPILRVRLPQTIFEGHQLLDSEAWASELYSRCTHPYTWRRRDLTGDWFVHFLDDPNSELRTHALLHAIASGPGVEEPTPIYDAKRQEQIFPWIDYFAYWQAYELSEVLSEAQLIEPILDTPDAVIRIDEIRRSLPQIREDSQRRLRSIRQRWQENQPIFDWISRYRTLLAIWSQKRTEWKVMYEAASLLLSHLAITPEQLKRTIRDVLLAEWQRWEWGGDTKARPRKLFGLLQEDIFRAVNFLAAVTGEPMDLDDPFWGIPKDRMNHGWAPMPVALPF
jgi:hypothetical protein